jgi:hypothetical protein
MWGIEETDACSELAHQQLSLLGHTGDSCLLRGDSCLLRVGTSTRVDVSANSQGDDLRQESDWPPQLFHDSD